MDVARRDVAEIGRLLAHATAIGIDGDGPKPGTSPDVSRIPPDGVRHISNDVGLAKTADALVQVHWVIGIGQWLEKPWCLATGMWPMDLRVSS